MDEELWSTGSATDPHPHYEPWPYRFLIGPTAPRSVLFKLTVVQSIRTSLQQSPQRPKEKQIHSVDDLTGPF